MEKQNSATPFIDLFFSGLLGIICSASYSLHVDYSCADPSTKCEYNSVRIVHPFPTIYDSFPSKFSGWAVGSLDDFASVFVTHRKDGEYRTASRGPTRSSYQVTRPPGTQNLTDASRIMGKERCQNMPPELHRSSNPRNMSTKYYTTPPLIMP